MIAPAPSLDLTTTPRVKQWLSSNGVSSVNNSDDDNIQSCITAFSVMCLWMTGNGPADGNIIAVDSPLTYIDSPLVKPATFDEWYDGNGHSRLFLRHTPIQSVQLLKVGNYQIGESSDFGNAGFKIDTDRASLVLRSGAGSSLSFYPLSAMVFTTGMQNVHLQYTAGFVMTPPDLELVARKVVSLNYKRRDWIGMRSKSLAQGAGTTSYQDYEMAPEDERVVYNYTRVAPVG